MSALITLDNVDDLLELRALYARHWPAHALGYYTIDNYLKWLRRASQLRHVAIYTLADEWRRSGLFLVVDRFQLFVNALDAAASATALSAALRMLDWRRGYKLTSIPDAHNDTVTNLLQELGVKWRGVRLHLYRLSRARALDLEVRCPAGFQLRPLTAADAGVVNGLWYSRQPGTLQLIERLIAYNISVGVCAAPGDELAGWCIRCQCGLLGMLHVKQAFRRRGLAALLSRAFARQVAETGDEVLAMVSEHNRESNALFRKLDFELLGVAHHKIACCVASENELWSPDCVVKRIGCVC